jgi:hypothetical protein
VIIFRSSSGASQFDSGMYSDPRQSFQSNIRKSDQSTISTDKSYTSSVLERLDSLETKISTFSSKSENNCKVKEIPDAKEIYEDLEIKQLLFRKLTQFRNKRTVNCNLFI